jgi:hypothetical protein
MERSLKRGFLPAPDGAAISFEAAPISAPLLLGSDRSCRTLLEAAAIGCGKASAQQRSEMKLA